MAAYNLVVAKSYILYMILCDQEAITTYTSPETV